MLLLFCCAVDTLPVFPLSNAIGRLSWDILGPQALIGFSFDGGCQVCVKLPHLYNKLRNYFCTFSFCGAPFEIGNIRFCVQKYFIYIILKNYPVSWWGSTKTLTKADRHSRPGDYFSLFTVKPWEALLKNDRWMTLLHNDLTVLQKMYFLV